MPSILKRLWRENSGDDTLEYALLVALIAIATIPVLYSFGSADSKAFDQATVAVRASGGSAASHGSGGNAGGDHGNSGGHAGGDGGGEAGGGGNGQGSNGQGGGDQGGGAGGFPVNPAPVK